MECREKASGYGSNSEGGNLVSSIYSKIEAALSYAFSDKIIPRMVDRLGFECEVIRGSKTSDEFEFYGIDSRHSPVSLEGGEVIRFEAKFLIDGNEDFYVSGIDIASTVRKAVIYSARDVELLPNDYIRILKEEVKDRFWQIIEPERVGMTVSVIERRYFALAVEGFE
jgi:hypothetical protein